MKDVVYKIAVRVVPFLVSIIVRCWFFTCKERLHNGENLARVKASGKQVIATFWHYTIPYVFYHVRKESAVAMVSASKDGEYIARFAGHFGFSAVRGSSNKRGLRALKQLIGLVSKGDNAAIVADGSQGPALKVQAGSILIASKSGGTIVPMLWSASSYIAFGSWDRTSIPKPFSTIDFYYGKPLEVPKGISSEEIEKYRKQLEDSMVELYETAWQCHGKESH